MPSPPVDPSPRRGGWKGWLAAIVGGAGAAHGTPAAPEALPSSAPTVMPEAPLARVDTLVYKTTPKARLKLHFARPSTERFPGPRPCIVFFHGGAWRTGDPKQFTAYANRLAEVGVIGISAQYRLMSEDDALPLLAVQDARSVLRFVRAKATRLGCDVQRIGAGGGSSGGHLALMTAVPSPSPKAVLPAGPIDDPTDDLSVSPRPQALFLMNPPLNLERYDRPVPVEQRRQLSPTLQIDASLPPTWIFHGTADKVVPFSQVTEFRDRAKALGGGEVTVQAFSGRGHGFFNAKRGDGKDFEVTLAGIVAGLKKLGWVQ
ncbi:MAG TPA: alpha/beta hydrolase [Ideonella sp.]|jgi:acetyl esterase/lipase|nr:alpha/beta hydrolase [Ideonella sp.]